MIKIINDETILQFFDSYGLKPVISLKQLQAHLDYPCGCKITQDNKGNWLFPCGKHETILRTINGNKLKTFRNNKFVKRDYEATNVVFCQAADKPEPKENWSECAESEIKTSNCDQLCIQADVKYFGYL